MVRRKAISKNIFMFGIFIPSIIFITIPFIFELYMKKIISDSGFPYYPSWIPYANFRNYFLGPEIRDLYHMIYGDRYIFARTSFYWFPLCMFIIILNIGKNLIWSYLETEDSSNLD